MTGNGVPQLGGEGRPGDNLFLCSVVALDMKTGKLRWHCVRDAMEAGVFIGEPDERPSAPSDAETLMTNQLYQELFAASPDGILLVDAETQRPIEFNDAACRSLGYTRDEFMGLRIMDYEASMTARRSAHGFRLPCAMGWSTSIRGSERRPARSGMCRYGPAV